MSKGRAVLETVIISIIIPVIIGTVFIFNIINIAFHPIIVPIVFVISALLYSKIVYTRHKDLGNLFIFLTVLLSIIIQFFVIILIIMFALNGANFSSGEGHPNGDAILVLMVLFLEPVLINLSVLFIWFIKKVIWLFTED